MPLLSAERAPRSTAAALALTPSLTPGFAPGLPPALPPPPRIHRGTPPPGPIPTAAEEILVSLAEDPPRLSPKFFYDAAGCALYERICELPEYYPPRVERAILDRHQVTLLAGLPDRVDLVDIGSGDGLKARRWMRCGIVDRYIGLDIAEDWLLDCLLRGQAAHPDVDFEGVVTDLTWGFQLPVARRPGLPRLLCYPGSSIGNFEPAAAVQLLRSMRQALQPGDHLLLGADGPGDADRLVRAYDDAAGVTAAFNLNVLQAVSRALGVLLDPADYAHRAVFDPVASRIEMHLVARRPQVLPTALGPRRLEPGDWIVTEHSYKHPAERMATLLEAAGFARVRRHALPDEAFGVFHAEVVDAPHG